MEWMIMPLKRYADFQGRSRRMEYWMFQLLIVLVALVAVMLFVALAAIQGDSQTDGISAGMGILIGVCVLAYLAIIVPALAVTVRRFHDQDKSGWLILINFVPYVGGLIVMVFMFLEGTRGPNQYGADPKNPEQSLGDVFR